MKNKNTSVINKILKQLTSERIKKELAAIQAVELPPELQKWVKEYEKVGDRNPFIWKWSYVIVQIITAPYVSLKYYRKIWRIKFLLIMFIILIDDVVDKEKNDKLFKVIKQNLSNRKTTIKLDSKESKYLRLIKKIITELKRMVNLGPQGKVMAPILQFDFAQLINSMEYANLLNYYKLHPNLFESIIYLSHAIPAVICFMIDMCFTINKKHNLDVGLIREIAWYLQIMGRIDNWLVTAGREAIDNDNSNIIISEKGKSQKLSLASNYGLSYIKKEKYFLQQWDEYYHRLEDIIRKRVTPCKNNYLSISTRVAELHFVCTNKI